MVMVSIDCANDSEVIKWEISEQSPPNLTIGDFRQELLRSMTPTELNRVQFKILPKPKHNLTFLRIDQATGKLTTSEVQLDREEQCPSRLNSECLIDVNVGLVGAFQLLRVIQAQLHVIDINDNAPAFQRSKYEIDLTESAGIGTTITLPVATDLDEARNSVHEYFLNPSMLPRFILKSENHLGTVISYLILNDTVDRETSPSYRFTLSAVDGGTTRLTGSTEIEIVINDVNDNPPSFDRSEFHVRVPENLTTGSPIFVALARDPDAGMNAYLEYTLAPDTASFHGWIFSIGKSDGIVSLSSQLDFEKQV